ncbi:helix-turn-helix domain-containing protein, partial [Lachnospiraceae bacterium OM02-3]
QVRMEAAKSTLRNTDIPASEIAALVGYEDPRYFYKVFKKYTGLTPTEYRS